MGVIIRSPVTIEELTAVQLATKGENRTRRQFPPEVVAAWLAAEVEPTRAAARRGSTIGEWAAGTARVCLNFATRG